MAPLPTFARKAFGGSNSLKTLDMALRNVAKIGKLIPATWKVMKSLRFDSVKCMQVLMDVCPRKDPILFVAGRFVIRNQIA
jgi:hypothetical protein